jgi:hypothetical protein
MPCSLARAAFHLMQIEQVIGGVNGDTTAQAIQLRMRNANQGVLTNAKVESANASGVGHVILERMPTNVPNDAVGSRVLLATANFANYTNIPLVADYIMDPIPASILNAGRLKFMSDSATAGAGTIYWSLSWGGSGYTGSNTGATDNDDSPTATGDFGPPVIIALPSTTLQALQFTGTATALSTSNSLQYALTAGASTWVNNAGTSFTLVAPPTGLPGDYNDDDVVDAADYVIWRKHLGTNFDLNGNGDESGGSAGVVDQADLDYWKEHFGDTPGSGNGSGRIAVVPEPVSSALLLMAGSLGALRRRRS